jgi:hypothetical protein
VSAVVRPIRLLGRHALSALEARVQAALEVEVAGWLQPHARSVAVQLRAPQRDDADGRGDRADRGERDGDAEGRTPHARSASDGAGAASPPAFERFDGAHGRLWIRCRPVDRRAWLRASLGEGFCTADDAPADAWAAAVADEGWQARNAALCEALTGAAPSEPADGPDEALHALGSGAVQIEAPALGLFALADPGVLRHVPPRPSAGTWAGPPRMPLERAAARAGVVLDVSVGRVEIGLRTLLELRPGDVLRLPTRLDDTLPLGPAAAPPLRCALGESAGRAAVRICSLERKPA